MPRLRQRIRSTIGAAVLAVSLTQCDTEGINGSGAVEVIRVRVLNLERGLAGAMVLRGSGGLPLPVEVVFEHGTKRGDDSVSAWVPRGNAAVTWRASGQVTFVSSETVTGADGRARATVMLGLDPSPTGGVGATIRYGESVSSTDVSVEIVLPELVLVSGNGQSGIGATGLAEPLVVQLLTEPSLGPRRPVPNVVIHFDPLNSNRDANGFVEPASVVAGADGRAAGRWVLGYDDVGRSGVTRSPQQQIAHPWYRDPRLPIGLVGFSATVAAPRFDIQIVSGDAQTGTPGQPLRESLVATVTTTNATGAVQPARGVQVTWSPSAGASASPNSSVTDAQGRVSTAWTLGPQLGPQTTGARVSSTVNATFTATAVGGRALRVVSGDRQLDLPGATLQPIIVEYVEFAASSGTPIPIPNAIITSTVSSGGGLVTPSSATTNAQGRVTVAWTLGTAAGDQIIHVATPPIPNADPASIFGLDIHATAALRYVLRSVSGNNQSGQVSALLASPLEVELVAINPALGTTTPVANQIVNWTALSGGGTLPAAITRTNAQGRNTAEWTLGASLGVQGARASVLLSIPGPGSVLQADFSATAGTPPRIAYALVNESSIAAGRADAAYAFNATGGDITVQTIGTGRYDVTFPNLRTPAGSSTTVLVSAYGRTTVWCKTVSWRNGVSDGLVASVACFDRATPASSEFTILVLGKNALPGRFAFAHASQPGESAYTPPDSASFSSTNQTITATRDDEGTYRVVFPGLTRPSTIPMDGVLATAVGPGTARCAIESGVDPLSGVSVPVGCVDPTGGGGYGGYGARTDATFVVMLLDKGRPGMRWGYAYAGGIGGSSGSTLVTTSVTSTGSLVRQARLGTGRYELTFPGLARPGGATEGVQVTSAHESDYCKVLGWQSVGQDLAVQVQCYDGDDLAPTDQDFTIVVIQ